MVSFSRLLRREFFRKARRDVLGALIDADALWKAQRNHSATRWSWSRLPIGEMVKRKWLDVKPKRIADRRRAELLCARGGAAIRNGPAPQEGARG
ncbi:hypothetical protein [Bradyrhizobium sp. CW10]|uniref:hypothetical protein n=1 Tax=Bradyrhizobium sp. CW10 TaxID=2782683 RepID=UPI001FF88F2F|nr:hypothetical protein [Bradyrhizobium sp. CW10]MCK1470357.1 hypothetical protein [Bradyrhizobium sp. CW10]